MSECQNCGKKLSALNESYGFIESSDEKLCGACRAKMLKAIGGQKLTLDFLTENRAALISRGITDNGLKHLQRAVYQYENPGAEDAAGVRYIPPEESVKRFSGEALGVPGLVFRIEGARGRSIDIYPYKCVITTAVTLGSVLTNNATDGEKTIYYQDCIGLQVKQPGLTLGYVQLETAAATQNNAASNFFNENSFTYEATDISSEEMAIVVRYIKERLDKIKEAQRNSWGSDIS